MAKKGVKNKHKLSARLVTENRIPCVFCQREVDDETTYGKLYAIGDIQCHYFCVLLSCCLIQKGKDEEGLFGFLYKDILAEVERSKKHKCSYCNKDGATLGCSISQCRKQFHLPCGREKNAVSLFYGNYKSFCQGHAPKQKIPDVIMSKAKVRMQEKKKALKCPKVNEKEIENTNNISESLKSECVCVICYEEVDAFPTLQTFWPPCCARDAWFHRSCIQRMVLSAGMHYLKCPLCNDKDNFYKSVLEQGYYVPDRDAAWELEQNAFAEIYERPLACTVEVCNCPLGRNHDSESGIWDIRVCVLCGSGGAHAGCGGGATYLCPICTPLAPEDIDKLAAQLETVIVGEQTDAQNSRAGPIMPSRMSLRRTKQRMAYSASTSSHHHNVVNIKTEIPENITNTIISREELNLKTPRKSIMKSESVEQMKSIENLLSPRKLLETKLAEKNLCGDTENALDESLLERLKEKVGKPRPLSKKKKIVDDILEDILNNINKEKRKTKEPVKEWNSPKKENNDEQTNENQQQCIEDLIKEEVIEESIELEETEGNVTEEKEETIEIDDSSNSTFVLPSEFIADHNSDESAQYFETPKKTKTVDIQKDSSMEIFKNNDVINIDLVQIENVENDTKLPDINLKTPEKNKNFILKFSPKMKPNNDQTDIDIESFKSQYLNEVDRDFKCNFNHKHESSNVSPKLRTAIGFAVDAAEENRKRKLKSKKSLSKRRKKAEMVVEYETAKDRKLKKRKKSKTKLSITNNKMKVKISLKKEKFRLKIMQSQQPKNLKQYILKYSVDSSKELIEKPEKDVTPIKRKYVKTEKSPDNFKQMSIDSFFKPKPSNN
ncbi:unnamed protein product [Diatraea saccharalis]|uniref:G2/M phase-specific E3 ubiquitin-protein ligase n=1 Tax=Diatraea saccharalis TaxID=40085 RepID=A0A9N9R6E7_9NEOP|nr:unnamed protein product [Diatraea saccharalis]